MSPAAGTHRLVEVAPGRLERWVAGFGERHGGSTWTAAADAVTLVGGDGALAEIEVPWPPVPSAEVGPGALAAHASASRTALLVLVRRGGYGAAMARDGQLSEHAVGTRYVQSRTAAGGWSQQRFARRRTGQAAALAGSATEAVLRVLGRSTARPDVVVVGGDRPLVSEVLADPRLTTVAALPRGPLLSVPDPRLAVLRDTAVRAQALRIRVTDPA